MVKSEKNCDFKLDSDVKINYEIFDTLGEIIIANRTRPHRHNQDTLNNETIDSTWSGANNYEEAEKLAIDGWNGFTEEQMDNIFDLKIEREEEKMVTFKNDIVGFAPIIPLVLQGVPNNMRNSQKKCVKSKIIHIVYNISTNCGTSSSSIMRAGMNLFKVIVKLESQGYRIRLTAMQDFSFNNSKNSSDLMILNLKSEYRPLDINSIIFPLIHTAMFRIIGFTWFERSPITEQRSGYGRNFSSKSEMIKVLENVLNTKNIKYIDYQNISDKSLEEIIELLKK